MECKVCFRDYDQVDRLPCGHFMCSVCVTSLLKEGTLKCPICCSQHTIPDIMQIPIAYDFEKLLSSINLASPEKREVPEPQQDIARDPTKLRIMQLAVSSGISDCNQMQTQLRTYNTTLDNLVTEHEEQIKNLKEMIQSHMNAQQLLKSEKSRLTDLQGQGGQQYSMLQEAAETLHTSDKGMDTDWAISSAEQCHAVTLELIKQCSYTLSDVNAIQQSAKLLHSTKRTIELMNQEIDAGVQDADVAASINSVVNRTHDATVLEKVNNIIGKTTETVTIESLQGLSMPARLLVEAGKVAAVLIKHGKTRHGRITLHDGAICLHHLQNVCPSTTQHPHTLPFYDFIASTRTAYSLVFLDLAWPGSPPGRVYIRITRDTSMAKNFVLLCTGELGPSYTNSHFFGVVCKGLSGECIVGGDYEYNNGIGGAAFIPDLIGCANYNKYCSVGDVGGWVSKDNRAAQFSITTKKSLFPFTDPRVFGKVEKGLEVAKAAAKCRNIKTVMVVDCGIVI
ncbi:uncharacterized protein LOC125032535 [Penaeus chinensis]|uniref:uncharacterized protein LOC125032535 n=1 Tax=Penaeus chinensis TaxID=139456 RepID=UPI001FB69E0A|nr:uncharacterized protein LOC125032535 [Penaeus chinensis]